MTPLEAALAEAPADSAVVLSPIHEQLAKSRFERRNQATLDNLESDLVLTPGWSLWPIATPPDPASAKECFLGFAGWASRRGSRVFVVRFSTGEERYHATSILRRLAGGGDGAPEEGDVVVLFCDGKDLKGPARSSDRRPSISAALSILSFHRDAIGRCPCPLFVVSSREFHEVFWRSAPDFWSLREMSPEDLARP